MLGFRMNRETATALLVLVLAFPCVSSDVASKYRKLRFEFASTDEFNPYALQAVEKGMIQQAMEYWHKKEEGKAFEKFREILKIYPYSIETHRRMADGYEILLDNAISEEDRRSIQELEKEHRDICSGLLLSITEGKEGKSRETAFQVITISEEYWTMYYLGYRPLEQELTPDGLFDVLTVEDRDGNRQRFFFNTKYFVEAKGIQKNVDKISDRESGARSAGVQSEVNEHGRVVE